MVFGSRFLSLVAAALHVGSTFGFGLTESGNNLVVQTDAGLVFIGEGVVPYSTRQLSECSRASVVNKANGDMTSIIYNGVQICS